MTTAAPQSKVCVDKAELFAVLRYAPHPGQVLVHNSHARFRVLACGVRWGKSTCAAMEAVCELLEPRQESIGWLVAPTYDLTQRIMTQVRLAFLERFPGRILDDDTRSQRLVINNLANGRSEMRGKSAENPTSLLGEGLDWVIVDEAAKLRGEIFESYIAPRLVDRKGRGLLISTPRGLDWFYTEFNRGQKAHDAEYESWRGSTLDNPNITEEVVGSEKRRLGKDAFAQEYLAEFLGERELPCESCGNPSDRIVRDIVFVDYATEARCLVCNGVVDSQGVTRHFRAGGEGGRLIIDLGPELRWRLAPGQDFATEVGKARALMESRRRIAKAG